jgi:hypothetical protein
MNKRLKELDKLINKVKTGIPDEIINEIQNKWKAKLLEYDNIKNITDLKKGYMLRYVSIDLKKISTASVIVDFIKDPENDSVKFILLKTLKYQTLWKIDPKKYYLFQTKPVKKKGNLMRLLLQALGKNKKELFDEFGINIDE